MTVHSLWPEDEADRVAWRAPLLSRGSVLHRIADELAPQFIGVFAPETVERHVIESYQLLSARAQFTNHVLGMTKRFARERLRALGQAQGVLAKPVPEVLFVCVHNAGRSQMAAGLLRYRAQGRVHVRSAGSAPTAEIPALVLASMAELGLDVSGEFPKPLTDEVVGAADVVVTMGCGDACPVYGGKRYLDWELADHPGDPVRAVRSVRNEIDERVRFLLDQLLPPQPAGA